MINIPENFTEFLYWVKENTERFWSSDPGTSTNLLGYQNWAYGAKWVGLSETEIDAVELKYSVRFTPEHREFLRILHTVDRKEKIVSFEPATEGENLPIGEFSFFYNWLEDEEEIRKKLNWPYENILRDVMGENQVWLKSWGNRPSSEEEVKKRYSAWYEKAPKLVPVSYYYFSVSDPDSNYHPILSVWGSDVTVYGWSLRTYLLRELAFHLDVFTEMVYPEEGHPPYVKLKDEVHIMFEKDFTFDENKVIPYWEEMIMYWSAGWSGFGLKYPYETESSFQRLMKANSEEGKNDPKTFTDFT